MNRPVSGILVVVASLLGLVTGDVAGQSVQVIDASFTPKRATLVSVSEDAVTVSADGQESQLSADELVRIHLAAEGAGESQGTSPFVLVLRNGDRLRGSVESLDEQGVRFRLVAFGSVEIALENLAALLRSDDAASYAPGPAPAADELLLMNGDLLSGFASEADAREWTFVDDDGQENPIDADTIRRLRFADPGVPVPEPEGAWRIQMADGSVLSAEELAFEAGRFAITYADRSVTVSPDAASWLEPAPGAVIWLTDLPLESEHQPYFGNEAIAAPAIINPPEATEMATVGKGLRVRSRTTVTVDVPEGARAFRVAIAVPRENLLANMDLRIRLGDTVAWEEAGVTAQTRLEPVRIDIAEDAERLTLEVDYGQGLDVQDVMFWLDPAFLTGGDPAR